MMQIITRVVPVLAVLLVLTGCGKEQRGFEGYVDGDFLRIGPDEPGRLTVLAVRQGETVKAGAHLFTVDTTTYEAAQAAAASRVGEAEANLANLLAQQQRPEEIAVLLARKDSAEADLKLARTQLDRRRKLYQDGFVAKSVLDEATAVYQKAAATLAQVNHEITTGRLSARINQISQARAAVTAAKADLQTANDRLSRRTVGAPEGGYIQDVFYYPGEVVGAGSPVVSLLPPERRKIVIFVPEPWRVRFKPGTRLHVTCDSCPDNLTAKVDWISAEEQFTPPVIFSPEERGKLVYRVEARPEQPLALSPGQPVTVEFLNGSKAGADR